MNSVEYLEFTPEELETEEWRDVVGFEDDYEVSNLGRVRRRSTGGQELRYVLVSANQAGYLRLNLRNKRRAINVYLHRLVAMAFIGPVPEGKEVNHIDHNRASPRASNLEYVTHLENMQYMSRCNRPRKPHFNQAKGEDAANTKLSSSDVIAIRRALLGGVRGKDLAVQYGVEPMTISCIKTGKSWRHLAELRDDVVSLGSWQRG